MVEEGVGKHIINTHIITDMGFLTSTLLYSMFLLNYWYFYFFFEDGASGTDFQDAVQLM